MTFIIPHEFKAGDKALAQDVNENFDYLKQAIESVNTSLDGKIAADISSMKNEVQDTLMNYYDENAQSKAEVDFSNIDATAKAAVVNCCLPDYSAGIAYLDCNASSLDTSEHSFTAPCDGVINVNFCGFNSNRAYVYVGGVEMGNMSSVGNSWIGQLNGQYSVRKDDVVVYKSGYGSTNVYRQQVIFYPLKGVSENA